VSEAGVAKARRARRRASERARRADLHHPLHVFEVDRGLVDDAFVGGGVEGAGLNLGGVGPPGDRSGEEMRRPARRVVELAGGEVEEVDGQLDGVLLVQRFASQAAADQEE